MHACTAGKRHGPPRQWAARLQPMHHTPLDDALQPSQYHPPALGSLGRHCCACRSFQALHLAPRSSPSTRPGLCTEDPFIP
jgi:hypothetical protein